MADRSIRVRLMADIQNYRQGMAQAAQSARQFGSEVNTTLGQTVPSLEAGINNIGRVGLAASAAIVGAGALATKAAVDWESAWAGVTKTVNGTEAELAALEDGLRGMAKELPATHGEIAAVAAAAGQLGIATPNIESFTRTMIDLGETTNLTADQAATALARFANIMQTPQSEVDRMGSTVVELGNNMATTEAEIVDMAMRLAGAGQQVGLTEAEVISLAAALSSVGIEAEMGGTAFSRVMIEVQKAVQGGTDKLDVFAAAAGMTTDEFTQAFRSGPAEAISAVIAGLGNLQSSGGNVNAVLEEMGLDAARVGDTLRRSAGAGTLMADALDMGRRAWQDNIALTDEAEKRYRTTAAQLEMFRNELVDLGISVGEVFLPMMRSAVDMASGFIEGVRDLPGWAQKLLGVAAGLMAIGGAALFVVPKIVHAVQWVSALAETAPRLASALKIGGGAMVALGAALVIGGGLLARYGQRQAEARALADEYTAAIQDQTGALRENIDAVTARHLVDSGLAGDVEAAGGNLEVFAEIIRGTETDLDAFREAAMEMAHGVESVPSILERMGLAATPLGQELIKLDQAGRLNRYTAVGLIEDLARLQTGYQAGTQGASDMEAAERALGLETDDTAASTAELGGELGGVAGDFDTASSAAEQAAQAVADFRSQVSGTLDPLFGMLDALVAHEDAQRGVDAAQRNARSAASDLAAAQREVADAMAITADEAEAAQRGIDNLIASERAQVDPLFGMLSALNQNQQAQRDARRARGRDRAGADLAVAESAAAVEAAAIRLAGAINTGQLSIEDANASLAEWVTQGLLTERQAAGIAARFAEVADSAVAMEGANVDAATAQAVNEARQEAAAERAERLAAAQERVVSAQERLVDAQEESIRAQDAVVRSAMGVYLAQIDLAGAIESGALKVDDAVDMLDNWVRQGLITEDQANRLEEDFRSVADSAEILARRREIRMEINSNVREVADAFGDLNREVELFGGVMDANLALLPIAGPRANGGPVDAGKAYLVGDKFGPNSPSAELFVPNANGWIYPDVSSWYGRSSHPTSESGGTSKVVVVHVPVPERKVSEFNMTAVVRQNLDEFLSDARVHERRSAMTHA